MRPILTAVILAATLAPVGARAETGMCEYRHPRHPNWDFFASCSYSETSADGVTVREVTVSNGSKFTTRDDGIEASVNGLAATRLAEPGAECWRTSGENERICIYPAGTIRPADAPPDETEMAEPAAPAVGVATFGGGVQGHCLLVDGGALVEQGRCTRRENCVDLGSENGASCLAEYAWASGRTTETASTATWITLDGAEAIAGDPGCVTDPAAARSFCWSTTAMTPSTHPILGQSAVVDKEIPAEPSAPAPEGEGEGAHSAGTE